MSYGSDRGKLFKPPVHAAKDLHAEADRLTARLLQIEARLTAMPWKLEVGVENGEYHDGDDYLEVGFERRAEKWCLVCTIGRAKHPILLKDASMTVKAEAAEMLPRLFEKMREEFDSRASMLEKGHAALDGLEEALSQGTLSDTDVSSAARKEGV